MRLEVVDLLQVILALIIPQQLPGADAACRLADNERTIADQESQDTNTRSSQPCARNGSGDLGFIGIGEINPHNLAGGCAYEEVITTLVDEEGGDFPLYR